jgi:hypothetical protein
LWRHNKPASGLRPTPKQEENLIKKEENLAKKEENLAKKEENLVQKKGEQKGEIKEREKNK